MVGNDPVALIMAGGSGTRFWPLSRRNKPKQYLTLMGNRSLIQQTVDRIAPLVTLDRLFVCSTQAQGEWLREQLPTAAQHILEPAGRNTAACLLLSTIELLRRGYAPDTVTVVLPADHYILDTGKFLNTLRTAIDLARTRNGLVLLGIVPDRPHTGYGYIESGSTIDGAARKVHRFVEKPDRAKAEAFLQSGGFYWNSGIFVWTLATISEAFQKWMPTEWQKLSSFRGETELSRIYQALPSVPIDAAVLEKAPNTFVIPVDMGWSDIGSWDSLAQLRASGAEGHALLSGEVHSIDSHNCLVRVDDKRKVALVGVDNLIIVENGDTLLISSRAQDQKVRRAAEELEPPPT